MKRASIVLVLSFAIASIVFVGKKIARASVVEPPARLSIADAIKLDRDLTHIREAEQGIRRLQEAAKPYSDDAMLILQAAKIDPQAFNKGEVMVDFTTGEITRSKVAQK